MTALDTVAAFLPEASVSIVDLQEHLGLRDDQVLMYRRLCGISRVRRAEGGTIVDLMLAAASALETLKGREHHVRYVVQALTLTSCAPYPINPVHDVARQLGLSHASSFSLTQHGCASGLFAIDLCGRLLAQDPDPNALALVFTGERLFTPRLELIDDTAVMGEGAAAILVAADGDRDRMLGFATKTYGEFSAGPNLADELKVVFRDLCVEALVEVIQLALRQGGLTLDDVTLVLPHNVNRPVWVRICKLLGLPLGRVLLDNIAVTGHCFSADPFINYRTALTQERLRLGDIYVMATLGFGATFSAMVFEH